MVGTIYLVDFQLQNSPGADPKELAIVGIDSNTVEHYLIRPRVPFSVLSDELRKQATYVIKHIHGLSWESGFIDLHDALNAATKTLRNANVIYVKGLERARYVRDLVKNQSSSTKVVDLNDFPAFLRCNTRPQRIRYQHCSYTSGNHRELRCSLEQATRYRDVLRLVLYGTREPSLPSPISSRSPSPSTW